MVTAVRWLLANPLTLYSHFRTPLGFHMYFVACASPIYRHSAALHSENIHSQVSQELQGQISLYCPCLDSLCCALKFRESTPY